MVCEVVGAQVPAAGAHHLVVRLVGAAQRETHVWADSVEGHDIVVWANTPASWHTQFDQVVQCVRVLVWVIEGDWNADFEISQRTDALSIEVRRLRVKDSARDYAFKCDQTYGDGAHEKELSP